MISKRWTRFTLENVQRLPNRRGAYELANAAKRVIYQGGSDAISGVRGRLLSHLRNNEYTAARYFRVEHASLLTSGIGLEASHAAKFQKKHGRKPRYTKRSPQRKFFLF